MMNMDFVCKLPIPKLIKEEFPMTAEAKAIKEKKDKEIRDIFEGKERKLILVIGPCSADNEDSVMDYITRLMPVQEKVKDKILIIPRIYTNKPRTTGDGYKGMLHQPDPNSAADLIKGIVAFAVPMKCFIPKIIVIFQIFFPMLPLVQEALRISSTDLLQAVLIFLWV